MGELPAKIRNNVQKTFWFALGMDVDEGLSILKL